MLRPLSSQNATHRTGLEISALDQSPDKTRAILAGREILKTIVVDGTKCVEEFNLLAAMRQYASHNSTRTRPKDALDIHDVKWSHHGFDTLIATAASSGRVVLYDINRPGVELARLHEHPRQVHKVAFNPHHGALLLSGSQDGTTKLWDMRDLKRAIGICPSQYTHNGQSDGVRDVKWSPTDGVEFAFGTDSGIVQRWDYRQPKAPKSKINAHNRTCHAIDWHPDGIHLVSAGSDKTLRVWNLASDARRQKPAWTLQAPHPVLHVRWRPPCRSSEGYGHGPWQSTHVVTSYDRDHSALHVWDFRRPNLPFRELLYYNAAPNDLLWHSQDLLWTVGKEGVFNQTDIKFAPKPTERRNSQAFAVAPHGELTCVSGESSRRNKQISERAGSESVRSSTTPKGLSPEKGSFGRSSTDDSIDEGFLSSSFKKRHSRSGSNRSAKSLSNTPPSYDDGVRVRPLDATLPREVPVSPNQIAARCLNAASIPNPLLFSFLAHVYISSLPQRDNARSLSSITKALEGNFVHAKRAGLHRVAQSFKTLNRILTQRPASLAIDSSQFCAESSVKYPLEKTASLGVIVTNENGKSGTDRAHMTALKQGTVVESSSSATTPLAKPRPDEPSISAVVPGLPDPDRDADMTLPPSLIESSLSSKGTAERLSAPGNENLRSDFHSMENRTDRNADEENKLTTKWQMKAKMPLRLDSSSNSQALYPLVPSLERYDSNESFPMFSASTESCKDSIPSWSSSVHSRNLQTAGPKHRADRPVTWDSQSSSNVNEDFQQTKSKRLAKTDSFHVSVMNMSGIIDNGSHTSPTSRNHVSSDMNDWKHTTGMTSTASSSGKFYQKPNESDMAVFIGNEPQDMQNAMFAAPSSRVSFPSNASLTFAADPGSLNLSTEKTSNEEHCSKTAFASPNLPLKGLHERLVDGLHGTIQSIAGLMLSQLMSYHTLESPDAQTLAHILLLLTPLMQEEYPCSTAKCQKHGEYDNTHRLSTVGQPELMTKDFQQALEQPSIAALHIESIMATYHDQLISHRLFNTAAQFRRLCFPLYPGVYDQFQDRTQIGLLCQFCNNSINSISRSNRCSFCKNRQSSCPICCSECSPFESSSLTSHRRRQRSRSRDTSITSDRQHLQSTMLSRSDRTTPLADTFAAVFATNASFVPLQSDQPPKYTSSSQVQVQSGEIKFAHSRLYTTCVLCNHSAHAACHRAWLARVTDGGCPTSGCLCDCARGTWRDAQAVEREQRTGQYRADAVRGDKWDIRESKAVAMVRGALGSGGSGRGEDGRRVRVVDPGPD